LALAVPLGRRDFFMAETTELVPELLEAGVHFGHQTKRWNPKMKPFIFEQRNQIYIINLDETVVQLRRATEFLQEVTRRGAARNRPRKRSRKRHWLAASFTSISAGSAAR
jgi:Ribosomal protein S2